MVRGLSQRPNLIEGPATSLDSRRSSNKEEEVFLSSLKFKNQNNQKLHIFCQNSRKYDEDEKLYAAVGNYLRTVSMHSKVARI
jgi:hypothetical protein